jgi:hypothetical protein
MYLFSLDSKDSNLHLTNIHLFYKAPLHATVGRRGLTSEILTNKTNKKHAPSLILPTKSKKPSRIISDIACRKRTKPNKKNIDLSCRNMAGRGVARALTEDPDFAMLDTTSPPLGQKRNDSNKVASAEKRSKATSAEKRSRPTLKEKTPPPHFWFGFETMERIAMAEGTSDMSKGKENRSEKETAEFFTSVFSYPHVGQTLFPLERPDGIDGQHFNITQLPFEVEVDPNTGLSYDYQVAIYFQKPTKQYTHEEILSLTQARLKDMRIALGTKIAEPITILCKNGSARHWSGTIKLHLKHPGVDGINLLNGNRPFIPTLDSIMTVGKIYKSYNTIARNNILSVKINSPSLGNVTGHALFKEIVEESFKREQELEITGVQKNTTETWAWLVAPTPTEAKKIVKFKATFRNEIIAPIIKTGERLTSTQLAKKNCLMLVLQGLNLIKTMEETLHEIKEVMGHKNISSSFFPKQRDNLHNGSVNIECLNPTVYRQFVNKTHRIHNSHVTFTPHPKSLEGTLPPSEEQRKLFGFCDINTTLVNTLEAIQNAPNNQRKKPRGEEELTNILKKDLKKELKNELKAELTMEFKEELATQKAEIITTANTFAQRLNSNLHEIMRKQMAEFSKEISLALTGGEGGPGLLALPSSSNQPNM